MEMVRLDSFGKQFSFQANPKGNPMRDRDGEILTLEEVAVYRLAQKGEIPAFKLGGTWRFRRSELDNWIAESINKKRPVAE
jgi:excisionase family DNA binding protein